MHPLFWLPASVCAATLLALGCAPEAGTAHLPGQVAGGADEDWWLDERLPSIVHVAWTQAEAGSAVVQFRVADEPWRTTPAEQRDEGRQEHVLLGVPFDADVEFQVGLGDEPVFGPSHVAHTGALPMADLQPDLLSGDEAAWEPSGNFLLTSINATRAGWSAGDYWILMLDRQARVVWAWPVPHSNFCLYPRPSLDGDHLLWDEITFWTSWDGGAGSQVHRMRLDGTEEVTTPTPGANHAFAELPDESIVWHAMTGIPTGTGGAHLEEVSPDGDERTIWDCTDIAGSMPLGATCLSNTVFWNEERDTFLSSFALEDFVLELDHESGDIVRVFGDLDGGWTFDPPESAFYVQHGVSWTAAGTLLLSTHDSADLTEGVVREYELDEGAHVLRQIWTYGEGEGVIAELGGDAVRLPGGNTLHSYGTTPRIKELTPDGTVAWDVAWPVDRMIGSTMFLDDLYTFAH